MDIKLKKSQSFQFILVRIRTFNIYFETTHNNQVFTFSQSFTNYLIHFFKESFSIFCRWRPIYTKTNPLFLWNCKLRTGTLTITRFKFVLSFADKALPNKFNKSTSMFMSISSSPYFISIELKLEIWDIFIQFSLTNY